MDKRRGGKKTKALPQKAEDLNVLRILIKSQASCEAGDSEREAGTGRPSTDSKALV